MTSKFWFLARQSLNKKIKTKWFLFANLLLAVVIIGLLNMDSIISFFGGDFSSDTQILLLDETKNTEEIFKTSLVLAEESLDLDHDIILETFTKDVKELEKELKENDKIGIVL